MSPRFLVRCPKSVDVRHEGRASRRIYCAANQLIFAVLETLADVPREGLLVVEVRRSVPNVRDRSRPLVVFRALRLSVVERPTSWWNGDAERRASAEGSSSREPWMVMDLYPWQETPSVSASAVLKIFKDLRLSVVQRHNVTERGAGTRAMVFAHGFGCDQNMWRFVAPAFEARYRVILFDHVGAGGSDLSAYDPVRYGSLDGYADDVVALCRALKVTGGVFVGHSVSAMIGSTCLEEGARPVRRPGPDRPLAPLRRRRRLRRRLHRGADCGTAGVPRQQPHGLVAGHGARHRRQRRPPRTR